RGQLLAGPDRAVLPPRDAADAGPVLGVLPRSAQALAQGRGRGQPHGATGSPVPAVRTAAGSNLGCGSGGGHPAVADRLGQLRVVELADAPARVRRDVRRRAVAAAAGTAGCLVTRAHLV